MSEPPRRPSPVKVVLAAVAAAGALAAGGAVAFVWFGAYDVSATGPHLQPVHSLLEFALKRAVQRRADAHPPPPDLLTAERVMQGAACFRDRCVACHGAPGVAPERFSLGMQPVPSSLIEATRHWRRQDLYWITRNGIKMSGMPAWEYRLDDGELWAVVAFLDALPLLTPDQYRALTSAPTVAAGGATPAPPRCDGIVEVPAPLDPPLTTAELARRAFRQHGCTACHTIPGVVGPDTSNGPRLSGLAGRDRIGGKAFPTEDGIAAWIRDPQAIDPHTAMPTLGISETQARLMARYLLDH
ncbi:c-type cytochrome [Mitsuaria sp. GD03876]|uniref:c-type cytochrome n=1 Tax=Mitsuaria sp. GD03876 TaxID=2975399 RepID=UPI002449B313|nr:c-type cytochrome [Mitsuaria sp. GD03876]MDH0868318.1 c-type cytochrome [Mitsuaria sp. GD03876]